MLQRMLYITMLLRRSGGVDFTKLYDMYCVLELPTFFSVHFILIIRIVSKPPRLVLRVERIATAENDDKRRTISKKTTTTIFRLLKPINYQKPHLAILETWTYCDLPFRKPCKTFFLDSPYSYV